MLNECADCRGNGMPKKFADGSWIPEVKTDFKQRT